MREERTLERHQLEETFDYQAAILFKKGYHKLLGIDENLFSENIKKLRLEIPEEVGTAINRIPLVIMPPGTGRVFLPMMFRAAFPDGTKIKDSLNDENEYKGLRDTVLTPYTYLLLDVDFGDLFEFASRHFFNDEITYNSRSPLTIAEGVILATYYSEKIKGRSTRGLVCYGSTVGCGFIPIVQYRSGEEEIGPGEAELFSDYTEDLIPSDCPTCYRRVS